MTPYGTSGISWKKSDRKFEMEVIIPVGSTAIVHVPADNEKSVTENGKRISGKNGIAILGSRNGFSVFRVGSGKYHFESEI
jgi:alpha-L-rhamnosidase